MQKVLLFIPAFFMAAALNGQTLAQADALYQAGKFNEAQKRYEELSSSADIETANTARLKSTDSLLALFQYQNAAEKIFSYPLPEDAVWKARFLLYRTLSAREVIGNYGFAMDEDETEGGENLGKFTKKQWEEKIEADYSALWDLRSRLINAPIENENLIINIKDTDTERIPTLFDFTVIKLRDFILSKEERGIAPLFRGEDYITRVYSKKSGTWNLDKLAEIYEEAYTLEGANRNSARGFWRTDRVLLPFSSDNVEFKDKTAARVEAANILNSWAHEEKEEVKQQSFFDKLFNRKPAAPEKFIFTAYAKAYAAYNAAGLFEQAKEYEKAHDAALRCAGLDGREFSKLCKETALNIEKEIIEIFPSPVAPDPADIKIGLRLRNVHTLYGRVYKTSPEELKKIMYDGYSRGDFDYLSHINTTEEKIAAVLRKEPLLSFEQNYTYEKKFSYLDKAEIKVPEIQERGLYIVLLSHGKDFDLNAAPAYAAPLNITDIMLAVSSGIADDPDKYYFDFNNPSKAFTPDIFRILVLNPATGEPVPGADVNMFLSGREIPSARSDAQGAVDVKGNFRVARNSYAHYYLSPLASYKGSYAYLDNKPSVSFSAESPVQVFVETDRAVYRPGQEVQIKVTAFERVPRGFKTYSRPYPVKLEIRNANYKTVSTAELKLNDFGSTAYKFTVPKTGLLGNYSINATVRDSVWPVDGYYTFKVEEYKRPEFEVILKDARDVWQYGREVKVEGSAKYYYGGGAADADVEYKVYRQDYVPYFFWWLRWYMPGVKEEVTYGKIKADGNGDFSFAFTPTPKNEKNNNIPSTYSVEVNVFDAGGRTIKGSKSYRASKDAAVFKIDMPTGFANAEQSYKIGVSLVDVNDNPQAGEAEFEVWALEDNFENNLVSLEQAFEKTKEVNKVFSVALNITKEKPAAATIPGMKEGVYKIKLKQKNGPAEQSVILLVAAENGALNIPDTAIAEHEHYYPGETARVLLGSGALRSVKYVELDKKGFKIKRDIVRQKGVSVYSFPVGEEHRGGLRLSWFGVSGYKAYSGYTFISVPHNDKELKVKIKTPESVLPGAKAGWTFNVTDYKDKPVNAEASVRVYDRSLDYYAKAENFLTVDNLYGGGRPAYYYGGNIYNSLFKSSFRAFDIFRGMDEYVAPKPLPHFNAEYSYRHYGYEMRDYAVSDAVMENSAPAARSVRAAPMMKSSAAVNGVRGEAFGAAGGILSDKNKGEEMEAVAAGIEAREDMSETAYYAPRTKVINGVGAVNFTMPQRLTSWNVLISAVTKNALLGSTTVQTATKKDLMIRLETPRFLREGDKALLKGIISNETKQDLTVSTVLLVKEDGKNAYEVLGFTDTRATTTVKAGGQTTVTWEAKAADGARVLTLSAVARAGKLSDGEVKELPILPSRERLVDTKVIALKNGVNNIEIADLKKPDNTRVIDVMRLQVDPNLLLPVLNSLPMLVEYPLENLFSLTAKYAPLAIVNNFYNKYPELKKAVAQLPRRDTIKPAWEAGNAVRQTLLTETPWLREAEGRKVEYGEIIDMFNPKKVARMESDVTARLAAYQNSDGGFSWFCGGKSSAYVTLYLLDNFAAAANQDVKVPEAMTKRAISFVIKDIDKEIKDAKETGSGQIVLSLYAAYVLTSFPKEWKETRDALDKAKGWLDYAGGYERFMTPLGKVYAANVYYRLNDYKEGNRYLDAVLDMLKVDDTAGAYFTPEEKSWLWYGDTLEKHAVTLRTLINYRPGDNRIDGMVKWLLFNRKGNTWDSTKSAASAIYALLDVMKLRGAFSKDTTYRINWGGVKEAYTFKPFDFIKSPLSFVKEGPQISAPRDITAQVVKSGATVDFASLTAVYSTTGKVENSAPGLMNVSREYFLRHKDGDVYKLRPVNDGDTVSVGDEIEVQLTITTSSQFEYVLIKDPRPAGFEAETLTSGWKWDLLPRYEEPRDSLTNFFVDWLPHGTYVLKYKVRPTAAGAYKVSAAQMQSMYAPEFAAHGANMTINVK